MAKSNSWRGHDWSSDLPLWDQNHPLFKEVGSAKGVQIVTTEYATTEVVVPDLDPELCEIVAGFAACFTAPFYKAQRIAPVVALERVARLYWELGNDPQKWLDYLARIGVKVAPQSRSEFIAFLRFICGNALDRSRRLGKMAWCLTEWVEIFDPDKDNGDGLGWPDPIPHNEVPGTSDFAKWVQQGRGYTNIAKARRARLRATGVAVNDNYSETELVITPDPEPPPEASSDGSRNPSPPEASGDGSSAERRVSGLRPEVNDGTAPPKPNWQTLPDWRRDPEEYGVALLHADSHKAMEVADAIFTAFFAITEAGENPPETAKQMSSGCPPIMHKLYEMRERIAELEAENDRLKITLRDQTRSEAGAEAEAI